MFSGDWWSLFRPRCCQCDRQPDAQVEAGIDGGAPVTDELPPGIAPRARKDKEPVSDIDQILKFISEVQLFKRLPVAERPRLAAACTIAAFRIGEVVIKQGDPGHEFFVITAGECSVTVVSEGDEKPLKVATLKTGDYFGENALLRDEPRSATITALTDLLTFKVTREQFQELQLNEKLQLQTRKAVFVAGMSTAAPAKPPSPKTVEERREIAEALRKNGNLCVMASLHDEQIAQLTDVFWKESVPEGRMLIKEGDLQADYFYIVKEGRFDVYVPSDPTQRSFSAEQAVLCGFAPVTTVYKGGSFGELALLYQVPRAATVKADMDSVVWVIDRQNFKNILMRTSDENLTKYVSYLKKCELLHGLVKDEKVAITRAMSAMTFGLGERIVDAGSDDSQTKFFVLHKGKVKWSKGQIQKELVADADNGTVCTFGDAVLLGDTSEFETVEVLSAKAEVLVIDKDAFEIIVGTLSDIKKLSRQKGSKRNAFGAKKHFSSPYQPPTSKQRRYHFKDLTKVGLLGCGGFGMVELYEHKESGTSFAMKGLSKGYIVEMNMQTSVLNEKKILLMMDSPFIVKLYECFNSDQMLFFLLELALGGELYSTYMKKGFHGSAKHAKFYVAGVVLAFEHVHFKKVIYRDLKPENLLLTEAGQLKLTDMGLATHRVGKAYTTCGTPDYFAPEMISSIGHTHAVDWWTLGILIFELMSGHAPFEAASPMQTYARVMKGITKIAFPKPCQGKAGDLIKALLQRDPGARLPMRPGGAKNIKEHAWYEHFNWDRMQDQTLEPPYVPKIKANTDLSNFAASLEDIPPMLEYKDDGSGWDQDFATC